MQHKNLLNTQELLTLVNDAQNVLQEPIVEYDEPLVKFVNQTLIYAFDHQASDIHLEPFELHCRIRLRFDGVLKTISEIPMVLFNRFVTRLKVLAKLNIAEKRLPQDGRFRFVIQDKKIDVRISICPTLFGEKIVLRLLNMPCMLLQMNQLGLSDAQLESFIDKISQPQGLIIVVGPTGSGKTVTLYSALQFLNTESKNISTIEDPIEIELPGVNQVNVYPKVGLTFENALRAFLRQDPDIIMIGEIRDKETASIAIQAAQTGHLVFASLHCNNTHEAFLRLHSFGLSYYDISQAISLVIAQRLVRKKINSEYKGRIGIFELLTLTHEFRENMQAEMSHVSFTNYMKKNNFSTLQVSAKRLVEANITDEEEIRRILVI